MPVDGAKALKEWIWRPALACAAIAFVLLLLASSAHAAFPGKNGMITFGGCGPDDCGLVAINPDGSGFTQLTHNPGRGVSRFCGCSFPLGDGEPAWSADGTKVVFLRAESFDSIANVATERIWVANADGSGAHSLGVDGEDPVWSPDGTKIAFWAFAGPPGGSAGIFVMNADGSGITRIIQGRDPRTPDWSPDGTKIAYSDSRPEGFSDPEIFVLNADGTNPTSLTPPDFRSGIRFENYTPSWAPDGNSIAFSSGNPSPRVQSDIYVIRSDGSGRTKLSETVPERSFADNPAWSPDGTKILYFRHGQSGGQLVAMDANGANARVLVEGAGNNAAWQPLPGPKRSDYKNAAHFCKAERDFMGDADFTAKYGGGANAYGKCVSQSH
jgi:Tol biopolymer transport system component